MDANVSAVEYPYFVWQIQDFSMIRKEVKKNCSFRGKLFNITFQKKCSKVLGDEFQICIEEICQNVAEEDTQDTLSFNVRTYVPEGSESKKELFLQSSVVVFRGTCTPQYVWRHKTEEFLNDISIATKFCGKVWFICVLEPRRYSKGNHEMTTSWYSLEALSSDLSSLLNTEGDFRWNNKKLHRAVFEARCPLFLSKILSSSELDKKCLDLFVKYIYCGRLPEICISEAQKLYKFGSRYNIKDLMNLCARILATCVEEENVYDLLSLADKSNKELIKLIAEYLLQEGKLNCDKWLAFAKDNKDIALEVYRIHAEQN